MQKLICEEDYLAPLTSHVLQRASDLQQRAIMAVLIAQVTGPSITCASSTSQPQAGKEDECRSKQCVSLKQSKMPAGLDRLLRFSAKNNSTRSETGKEFKMCKSKLATCSDFFLGILIFFKKAIFGPVDVGS